MALKKDEVNWPFRIYVVFFVYALACGLVFWVLLFWTGISSVSDEPAPQPEFEVEEAFITCMGDWAAERIARTTELADSIRDVFDTLTVDFDTLTRSELENYSFDDDFNSEQDRFMTQICDYQYSSTYDEEFYLFFMSQKDVEAWKAIRDSLDNLPQ